MSASSSSIASSSSTASCSLKLDGDFKESNKVEASSSDSTEKNIHPNKQATNLCPAVTNDFGQHFVNVLLPHVKSFAYTWFHLQAAKRKHFKNEDKRMSFEEEFELKSRLMNEPASLKIKWAVRLLMKLRKDIHKNYQSELIEIITSNQMQQLNDCKCVVSNPDMKGKMRRIDCLRQSDKVWRLDLVMVVLFKGIPLESSDGERIDKLSECTNPHLCINPNHALLNVRDLEVFLANYVNNYNKNQPPNSVTSRFNEVKLYCNKNIVSPSVFTPQEFLTLSDVSIIEGASELEIRNSLSFAASSNHFSDNNDEIETTTPNNIIMNQTNSDLDDKDAIRNMIKNSFNKEKDLPNATNSNCALPSVDENNGNHKRKKLKTNKNQNENGIPKSNIKINEIIEHMHQQQRQNEKNLQSEMKGNQQNTISSHISLVAAAVERTPPKIDFELKNLKELSVDQDMISLKPTKAKKICKVSKKEAIIPNVGDTIEKVSPGKAITKRRRSSQKTIGLDNNDSLADNSSNIVNENASLNEKTSTSRLSNKKHIKLKKDQNISLHSNNKQSSTFVEKDQNSTIENSISNVTNIEDHSSCSTSSQQDEEIKELLMRKNNQIEQESQPLHKESNQVNSRQQSDVDVVIKQINNLESRLKQDNIKPNMINSSSSPSNSSHFSQTLSFVSNSGNKIITDELKDLIKKEKQTTTDLFLHLLKVQEDHNFMNTNQSSFSQNQNSNENLYNDLANSTTNILLNSNNFIQTMNHHQQMKSTTPVFELLMSPLFSTILPSSGSCSNSSSSSSNSNNSTSQNQLLCNSFNQFNSVNAATAAALSAAINLNKSSPSSSPTIGDQIKLNSSHSSFKRTKEKQSISKNQKHANNSSLNNTNNKVNIINSSLINALRFDSNSNGSYDEILNLTNQTINESNHLMIQQKQNQNMMSKIVSVSPSLMVSNQRPVSSLSGKNAQNLAEARIRDSGSILGSSGTETPTSNENIEDDEEIIDEQILNKNNTNRLQAAANSTSPPPPPSIGTSVINSSITAPSPTKLLQFYPYAQSSTGHVMHRPIPILQKPENTSLLNTTTTTNNNNNNSSLNRNNSGSNISTCDSKLSLANNGVLNVNNRNETTTPNQTSKTPNELSDLIKMSQHQQNQLLSTLRSNSASNNSPLMFSINSNNSCSLNNNSNNFMSSFSSNSTNLFSNYPNISPANGMNGALIGGNGNASPTSSLFPSITSLFQSPIGTPRVTPTPQQYAAYLFNDDQFHSLIFPSSSLSNNSNGAQQSSEVFIDAVLSSSNAVNNLAVTAQTFQQLANNTTNNSNPTNLSPLFNNLISASQQMNQTSNDVLNRNSNVSNNSSKQNLL